MIVNLHGTQKCALSGVSYVVDYRLFSLLSPCTGACACEHNVYGYIYVSLFLYYTFCVLLYQHMRVNTCLLTCARESTC